MGEGGRKSVYGLDVSFGRRAIDGGFDARVQCEGVNVVRGDDGGYDARV